MLAPKRYCCGERHWPIEGECPNRKPARKAAKGASAARRNPKPKRKIGR